MVHGSLLSLLSYIMGFSYLPPIHHNVGMHILSPQSVDLVLVMIFFHVSLASHAANKSLSLSVSQIALAWHGTCGVSGSLPSLFSCLVSFSYLIPVDHNIRLLTETTL